MGHGDELEVADGNFPAASLARRLVRLDGVDAPRALRAILSVLPLDTLTPTPAVVMAVVVDRSAVPEPVREFQAILDAAAERAIPLKPLERFAFYERTRAALAVIATGERRPYGNILLVKGVVAPAP
jgi:L-fucose mutarotase